MFSVSYRNAKLDYRGKDEDIKHVPHVVIFVVDRHLELFESNETKIAIVRGNIQVALSHGNFVHLKITAINSPVGHTPLLVVTHMDSLLEERWDGVLQCM